MDEQTILDALAVGETRDWEFKSAKGGVPASLWETYCAMTNTDGGTIVLGVEETDDEYGVSGLHDTARVRRDFWNTVNNCGKVSANLLSDDDVRVEKVSGRPVLVICVPRADRRQRPIYVGQNPLTGTYRRNYEGDYHCNQSEVGRMLADQAEEPVDSRILPEFSLEDIDADSLKQYRQRFSASSPTHPWLSEDAKGLLIKLGGWRRDRTTGQDGLTVAGLLMFGKDEAIRDPRGVPQFGLDYREKLSDDPETRWTDRLVGDGTWVCNLFQFYHRSIGKLTSGLKMPFQLDPRLFRKDDTIVHEAVREALANALIHADYQGQGGIVVEKYRDRLEFSNPGTLLLSLDQILTGGISECRNKALQTMFMMIGGGEKAGSGMDKIRRGWESQQWRSPKIEETCRPDRVRLVLPMVSLLPQESLDRLAARFGRRLKSLDPLEVKTVVTADIEGGVSNSRMREIATEHPADLTRALQGLVKKGFLLQYGQKRGTTYRLPPQPQEVGDSARKAGDSVHKAGDSVHKTGDSVHMATPSEADPALLAIAEPARRKRRLPHGEIRRIIRQLCTGRYLTLRQIASLLERHPDSLRPRFIKHMVESGELDLQFASEPNRPDQAYTASS